MKENVTESKMPIGSRILLALYPFVLISDFIIIQGINEVYGLKLDGLGGFLNILFLVLVNSYPITYFVAAKAKRNGKEDSRMIDVLDLHIACIVLFICVGTVF